MAKVTLTIDDQQVQAEAGTTVLEAAKLVGCNIPHYCYHPGLSVAGNCRMCLVEVEKAPKPMIGCSTIVAEGMVVKTKTPKVEKMRQSVMEFLLINHPLDCPTCDQAGECRLQDYYMSYDQIPSRFAEDKVEKNKIVDLGANIMLDQERCIACTRCVRFCDEVAGQDELAIANRGDHHTITTFPGKKLQNPYAGNVVDICPVGALTNKEFRFKKRVWFLTKTKSICPGCSRGCNTEIYHADKKVYRLMPRENLEVNKYWMCDEGRYAFTSINENRVLRPLVNGQEVSFDQATDTLADLLLAGAGEGIAVIAHAWETNETLKAISDFAKDVMSVNQVFYSKNDPANPYSDEILMTADKNPNMAGVKALGLKPVSEIKNAKAVLVFNSLSDTDLKFIQSKNIPVVGLWASNQSALVSNATVVFPSPTYAEQDGHFTNVQGKVQRLEKAFDPRGESRLVAASLVQLKKALELKYAARKGVAVEMA